MKYNIQRTFYQQFLYAFSNSYVILIPCTQAAKWSPLNTMRLPTVNRTYWYITNRYTYKFMLGKMYTLFPKCHTTGNLNEFLYKYKQMCHLLERVIALMCDRRTNSTGNARSDPYVSASLYRWQAKGSNFPDIKYYYLSCT